MTQQTGFNLLGNDKARILILGSMPSVVSLDKQQYYGNPRNAFWRIMATLFNQGKPIAYQLAEQLLEAQGIAVWDVLKSCTRQGSLDASIDKHSVQINDFGCLFKTFVQVQTVFFNGGMAESLYKKHVYQALAIEFKSLNYTRLPSTSPAYAAMRYEEKLAAWSVLKKL
ncbi:DNA-deoxyinosine glycosylase [Methyloprofundus sp.]|uniref:DNA-deoxyinosine glycosylase n=1 Tax=Methyloprofundus sp. TaxID=2020875 RepID=UPI003D14A21A